MGDLDSQPMVVESHPPGPSGMASPAFAAKWAYLNFEVVGWRTWRT